MASASLSYRGYCYPGHIISQAVHLYYRFPLSYWYEPVKGVHSNYPMARVLQSCHHVGDRTAVVHGGGAEAGAERGAGVPRRRAWFLGVAVIGIIVLAPRDTIARHDQSIWLHHDGHWRQTPHPSFRHGRLQSQELPITARTRRIRRVQQRHPRLPSWRRGPELSVADSHSTPTLQGPPRARTVGSGIFPREGWVQGPPRARTVAGLLQPYGAFHAIARPTLTAHTPQRGHVYGRVRDRASSTP